MIVKNNNYLTYSKLQQVCQEMSLTVCRDSIYIISLLPLCIPHLMKGEDFIFPFGRGEGEFPDTPVIVLNIISVCLLPVPTCSTHNPVNKMASAVGRKRAINEENRKFNEACSCCILHISASDHMPNYQQIMDNSQTQMSH